MGRRQPNFQCSMKCYHCTSRFTRPGKKADRPKWIYLCHDCAVALGFMEPRTDGCGRQITLLGYERHIANGARRKNPWAT